MKRIKRVLSFPPESVEEPVTYNLVTGYGIHVNILRASIDPGKRGRMVVELGGDAEKLQAGIDYLRSIRVAVEPLAEEIRHHESLCTGCTACIPHCPTAALDVDRNTWRVVFQADRCIVCRSCVEVCIYGAVDVSGE